MSKEKPTASSHPHIPALRPGRRDSKGQDLRDWSISLLSSHGSPTAVLEWQITAINWYKNKTSMEHEYPVFTVRRESTLPVELYLRFDRRSSPEALQAKKGEALVSPETYKALTEEQKKKVTEAVDKERQSLIDKHLKGIIRASKASSGKGGGFEPEDTIKHTWYPHGVDKGDSDEVELLVTYLNFRHPFPLRDLAIISQVVVETSDAYLLLVQQCYWLARTMVAISAAKYQPQPEEGVRQEGFSRAGRISRFPFLSPINSDNPTEIAVLVEQVNREIEQDDIRVQAEYMNGEGGRIAAEEGRAAAEEKLAKEQKRRSDAENRARELEVRLAAYAQLQ